MAIFSTQYNFRYSQKIILPAAERNKDPILKVLQKYIQESKTGNVLEISSGAGQHVAYFASHFPKLTFQPSEVDESLFNSIIEYASEIKTNNIRKPIKIDASTDYKTWDLSDEKFDYLININLIQVSPFECTLGLFKGAGNLLKPNGFLFTYGPFAFNGVIEPQSNVDFDKELKSKDPRWGIREITEVKEIAKENGIDFVKIYDLPANNKCVVWKKIL